MNDWVDKVLGVCLAAIALSFSLLMISVAYRFFMWQGN